MIKIGPRGKENLREPMIVETAGKIKSLHVRSRSFYG